MSLRLSWLLWGRYGPSDMQSFVICVISLEGDSCRHVERDGCRLSGLRRASVAGRQWNVGSGECALQQVDLVLELRVCCRQVTFGASEAKDFRLERFDVVLGALTMGTTDVVNDEDPGRVYLKSRGQKEQVKEEKTEEGPLTVEHFSLALVAYQVLSCRDWSRSVPLLWQLLPEKQVR